MLISENYKNLNSELHESDPAFGSSKHNFEFFKSSIIQLIDATNPQSVLDYGCGKAVMLEALKGQYSDRTFVGYDPAIVEFQDDPPPCDFVYCLDVLEHVEPEHLDSVLSHIGSKVENTLFCAIATIPAKKILQDGRNAHLIVQNKEWWLATLEKYFRNVGAGYIDECFYAALRNRN